MSGDKNFNDVSMLELFRIEVDGQAKVLTGSLIELEDNPSSPDLLEQLMRASHSIKGAARMVDVDVAVRVAHVMEDCFVAAQEGKISITPDDIDILLKGADILIEISQLSAESSSNWFSENSSRVESFVNTVSNITKQKKTATPADSRPQTKPDDAVTEKPVSAPVTVSGIIETDQMMLDLFKSEVSIHTQIVAETLEQNSGSAIPKDVYKTLADTVYSLKGGAKLVDIHAVAQLAQVIDDFLSAINDAGTVLTKESVRLLTDCMATITEIAEYSDQGKKTWESDDNKKNSLYSLINKLAGAAGMETALPEFVVSQPQEPVSEKPENKPAPVITQADTKPEDKPVAKQPEHKSEQKTARQKKVDPTDTVVRVSSSALNRLMGLAGESIVESRRLRPYADSLLNLKRRQSELSSKIEKLSEHIQLSDKNDHVSGMIDEIRKNAVACRTALSERLEELEGFDRSLNNLSGRLNREVISSRMRPFSDGTHGFQRMVRDVGRSLNKKVKLEIHGLNTMVDRDILEKIEAPLNHLLRNSVDHGIEAPEVRKQLGKPEEGTIRLEAIHSSGMLSIIVEDDGAGVDVDKLKEKIIKKGMVSEQMANKLSEQELLEFLFLPSFSTRDNVTEVSGRGVGLDVVHSVVQEIRGVIRTTTKPGEGIRFQLQLPLTLSVIRALLVDISGEPYAFPLARIDRTLKLHKSNIEVLEGRQYFTLENHHIGIVSAEQILDLNESTSSHGDEMSVVIIGEKLNRYAIVVDQFLGERSMVVQKIDARLGKIRDIGSAAILDDGTPALIVDVDDMIRSIDLYISGGRVANIDNQKLELKKDNVKRILIVDDSITVREVERNMLEARGYNVEVAVDGMDGWNAVRTNDYDLVISDIDMPRMNGFEFVEHIKSDHALNALPVMIVSYKDREEDRLRGLEVGADYYLTKGSFQDETLLDAVEDLIGKAR